MSVTELDLTDLLHGAVDVTDQEDYVTAHRILDCRNLLGEGIIFDDRQPAVLWTDIYGKKLHKLVLHYDQPHRVQHCVYDLPKMLCSFGMLKDSDNVLLCAWDDGFQLYDPVKSAIVSVESQGPDVNPKKLPTRLNDGRVDPSGKYFICGGFYGDVAGNTMNVYNVQQQDDKSLVHEAIIENIQVANSIHWSPVYNTGESQSRRGGGTAEEGRNREAPDEEGNTLGTTTMYFADSPTQTIFAYDYDVEHGTVSNRKPIHQKTETGTVPDGSCVDADGYIWNACWRGGRGPARVERIDPATGHVTFTVHVPDSTSQITCCCFGGQDLDILFMTSAADGRDPGMEPHGGALYAVKLPFRGRSESRLNFQC